MKLYLGKNFGALSFVVKHVVCYLLLLTCVSLVSCSNDDGQDGMNWQSSQPMSSNHHISVSSDGGEFTLSCKNYSNLYLLGAKELISNNEYTYLIDGYGTDKPDNQTIHTSFATIKCIGEQMIVDIFSNNIGGRTLVVKVTSGNGDVVDEITFNQKSL